MLPQNFLYKTVFLRKSIILIAYSCASTGISRQVIKIPARWYFTIIIRIIYNNHFITPLLFAVCFLYQTCTSNELPETDDRFTNVLPLFTSVLSTDSLVTLSKMEGSNGCPGSHFGLAALTAAYIAERYLPSYCCSVHVPFALSSFLTLNWYSLNICDLFVVSPLEIPFS